MFLVTQGVHTSLYNFKPKITSNLVETQAHSKWYRKAQFLQFVYVITLPILNLWKLISFQTLQPSSN